MDTDTNEGSVKRLISKDEALALIATSNRSSYAHLVGSLMRRLARRVGADEAQWEVVGLLHDLDYSQTTGDRSQHGIVASERLQGQLDEDALHAIQSHDHRTGVEPKSQLDIALIVADATAVALEQFGDGDPSIETLRTAIDEYEREKPWISTSMRRCEEIGIDFEQLLTIALSS